MTTKETVAAAILIIPVLLLAGFSMEMWLKGKKIAPREVRLEHVMRSDYMNTASVFAIILLFVTAALVILMI